MKSTNNSQETIAKNTKCRYNYDHLSHNFFFKYLGWKGVNDYEENTVHCIND